MSADGLRERFVPFKHLAIGQRYLHISKGQLVPVTVRAILPSQSAAAEPGPSSSASRGDLVGIEYDTPALGKHSGTLDGREIFKTRKEGAGSFIKYNDKAQKGLYRGYTLVEALMERYGVEIPFHSASRAWGTNEMLENSGKGGAVEGARLANGREIEMPNMDGVARRVARLDRLQHAGLEGYRIWGLAPDHLSVGEMEELKAYIRANTTSLTSLDLTGSLLSGWASVLEITECLQALREIILDQSLLDFTINPIDSFPSSLQSLQLRACSLQPTDLQYLARLLPDLQRLDLANNSELTSIPAMSESAIDRPQSPRYKFMGSLNLAKTGIADWDDLLPVFDLCPVLQTLDLSDTPITTIPRPPIPTALPDTPIQQLAINLPSLIWKFSHLVSWTSIDNLREWTGTSLLSLRFSSVSSLPAVPADESDPSPCATHLTAISNPSGTIQDSNKGIASIGPDATLNQSLLIASLPSLVTLDGSAITPSERREAELAYIRHVQQCDAAYTCMSEPGSGGGRRVGVWGMYEILAGKHGVSMAVHGAEGAGASGATMRRTGALKSRLITLSVYSALTSTSSAADSLPQISLLPSTSISLLRKKLAKLLSFPSAVGMAIWTVRTATTAFRDGDGRPAAQEKGGGGVLERVGRVDDGNVGDWFGDGDIVWVDIGG